MNEGLDCGRRLPGNAKLRNASAANTTVQVRFKFEDGILQSAQYAMSSAVTVPADSTSVDASWVVTPRR